MSWLELLQTAAAIVAAVTVVGGAVWWILRPRFVELIRATKAAEAKAAEVVRELAPNSGTSTRDLLDRLERQVQANTARLERTDNVLSAVQEGMAWSGRVLDNLAHAVDRIGRQQRDHLTETRTRHRRFDPDQPWTDPPADLEDP